ncbi:MULTISPECIES: hypothetical protein [Stappiaceae]|jgi:hypothetical protein|uniref:Secreted protein n=2 Tax=Roseibium TaxID=150830 RepID=A0A0M6Y015_9HYPH|nr:MULTISPECIES: hypothetical protein [Stappiaceae]MCR9282766.1 hypothetical protein [Paracoccaceae bacterium]MEC9417804.1 hypothetical protein [Pseudomonadota bacterium]AMN53196.1 hypothetical protein ACP90_12905 [Labrenzia sp. CP4]AQQ06414.1 hypothetical protein B0E33_24840 [Roseibium aggregatum]ERP97683.1 hypothetical protein Q669_20985 [Labrenzia sp. C1B10]
MRKMLLCAAALALPGLVMSTAAEARPDLRKMTCAQAQNMVRQHGAVVFTTGQYTYSMFVSNRSYCDRNQVLFTQFGQTRDTPRCPVAFECKEPLFPRGLSRWD